MKKFILLLCGMLIMLMAINTVNATLITIGTATYSSATNTAQNTSQSATENIYNLIWDNNDDLVWLDYSNNINVWVNQVSWASGLNVAGILTYDIDSAYSVDWDGSNWRLPTTVDGVYQFGFDGTTTGGYNITTSEMGDLFYNELGNKGYYDVDGNSQSGGGLNKTGDFNNLIAARYWSSDTEFGKYPDLAWDFNMHYGVQASHRKNINSQYGLAVRSGQVSTTPIPEAATILLFGLGLLGLAGVSRKN